MALRGHQAAIGVAFSCAFILQLYVPEFLNGMTIPYPHQ